MYGYPLELLGALLTIVAVTCGYAAVSWNGIPAPSGLVGHGLGIVGFLMMLSTETLYALRKRVRFFNYGPTSVWLQVHIFTGIVGPYLVLLHTAGKFYGLAGVLTLVTILIVISGFVGRYIYTAAPRTLDGVEISVEELQTQFVQIDRQLKAIDSKLSARLELLLSDAPPQGWVAVLARPLLRWRHRRRVRRALQDRPDADAAGAAKLTALLGQRYDLLLQIHSLAATRRLLAFWQVLHVPLGGVLFTLAFIHIGAALYYATFSR